MVPSTMYKVLSMDSHQRQRILIPAKVKVKEFPTLYLVHGTWYLVPGTSYLFPLLQALIDGSSHFVAKVKAVGVRGAHYP